MMYIAICTYTFDLIPCLSYVQALELVRAALAALPRSPPALARFCDAWAGTPGPPTFLFDTKIMMAGAIS